MRRARCVPTQGEVPKPEAEVDPVLRVIAEARGQFEKLAGDASTSLHLLGSWQVVLWQPRWLYAERDALCYQRVGNFGVPLGQAKRIPFEQVTCIDEYEHGEFVLQCRTRSYVFKAADEEATQAMVRRLRGLCERWLMGSEDSMIKNLDTGVAVPLVSSVGVRSPLDLLDRTTRTSAWRQQPSTSSTGSSMTSEESEEMRGAYEDPIACSGERGTETSSGLP